MRRKPLFPPPQETVIDPVTKQAVTKRLANKGRQRTHVLTVNGRVALRRRWWHSACEGSTAPADTLIDGQGQTVTGGVIEMASRLNNDGASFDAAAENLFRTAQIKMSGEQLRQLVIAAGQSVLAAQRSAALPTSFQATDCPADPANPCSPTRLYTGIDGVMVPTVTDAEKVKRREAIKRTRQRSGKKCRPLPPRRKGSDEKFKEFKVVTFYDEIGQHWHEVLTRGRWHTVGPLVRREARRLNFAAADEKIANVDGATRIRNQLEAKPHELPLDGLGLDFYHLAENVHKSRRIVFGDSDDGRQWAEDILHTLKHEGYKPAWEQLLRWRRPLRSQAKKTEADRLINYVMERREMINYPEFIQRGWQIGSGPTESRCKTSTSRLKGRGRRWEMSNAEAVAALTTLRDSSQWDLFWTTPANAKT
jgi:hypothetical protein